MSFPKGILWDMDGVLTDTSQLHFETWERVLTKHGIPFDHAKFQHIYGLKNRDLLPILVGKPCDPQWVDRIADQKELAFRKVLPGRILLLPGVLNWLKRFHSAGCKQAVASSAPPENVDAVVDELGIRKYFAALVTPGNLPGKPDPAVFLKAATQLDVPPQSCLVIEDSIPGIDAAHKANMHCIGVATTNPPEALSRADIVVSTLNELSLKQIDF